MNDVNTFGPKHYTKQKIQPWDYIACNNLGFFEGNIIKYVTRWQDKGGVEDLKKAKHFLDKLIDLETAKCPSTFTALKKPVG